MSVNVTWEGIIVSIGTFTITILCCVLSLFFYKNVCCQNELPSSNRKITIASIITFTSFLISAIFSTIAFILYLLRQESFTILDEISGIFYIIGIFGLALIFILRIDYTFTGSLSIFAYSSKTIKMLYSSWLSTMIYIPLIYIAFNYQWVILSVIFLVLFLIHYGAVYILCCILFVKRAFTIIDYYREQLSESENETDPKMTEDIAGKDDTNNNNENTVINIDSIALLIRYTVLSFIGFITTLFTVITQIALAQRGFGINFADLVNSVDIFLNMLCIYSLFIFGKKLYYKSCGICDGCFKNCVLNKILENLPRDNVANNYP